MKVKTLQLSSVRTVELGRVAPLAPERLRGRARQARNARLAFRSPLCVECDREGVVSRAEEWDHKVPLAEGGLDDESNLQGLCHRHHAEKTAREAAARTTRAP